MWVGYTYYSEVFNGGILTIQNFNRYSLDAQNRIDYITLTKASNAMNTTNVLLTERIKNAVCVVAEMYYNLDLKIQSNNVAIQKTVASGITSESVKSHSISFAKESDFKTESAIREEGLSLIDKRIHELLFTTGLLYRGVAYV